VGLRPRAWVYLVLAALALGFHAVPGVNALVSEMSTGEVNMLSGDEEEPISFLALEGEQAGSAVEVVNLGSHDERDEKEAVEEPREREVQQKPKQQAVDQAANPQADSEKADQKEVPTESGKAKDEGTPSEEKQVPVESEGSRNEDVTSPFVTKDDREDATDKKALVETTEEEDEVFSNDKEHETQLNKNEKTVADLNKDLRIPADQLDDIPQGDDAVEHKNKIAQAISLPKGIDVSEEENHKVDLPDRGQNLHNLMSKVNDVIAKEKEEAPDPDKPLATAEVTEEERHPLPKPGATKAANKADLAKEEEGEHQEKLDLKVSQKVEKSLEKSMSAEDDSLTHISKEELNKEIAKESPEFAQKTAVEAFTAPDDAKDQASERVNTEHDDKMAEAQAGEDVKNVKNVASPEKKVKVKTEAEEEKEIAAEDDELMHVSKKELQAEIAKEQSKLGADDEESPTQASADIDNVQQAISKAQPVGLRDDGNPFKMTEAGRSMLVRQNQLKLTRLAANSIDAKFGASQSHLPKLTRSDKAAAVAQQLTKLFYATKNEKQAAKAQAKGMTPLKGTEAEDAKTQAHVDGLKEVDEEVADAQASEDTLSSASKLAAHEQSEDDRLTSAQQMKATKQAQIPNMSVRDTALAKTQIRSKLFHISQKSAIEAWRQSLDTKLNPKDVQLAARQEADFLLSQRDKTEARLQSRDQDLTSVQKVEAEEQTQALKVSNRDRKAAAEDAEPLRITGAEKIKARKQADFTPLSSDERMEAAMQAKSQHLKVPDALESVSQALEIPITKAEKATAAAQADGLHYTKVMNEAQKQIVSELFRPKVKDTIEAMKQAEDMKLKVTDKLYAHDQAVVRKMDQAESSAAKYQAMAPRYSVGNKLEAMKLAAEPKYKGIRKKFAQAQAQLDELTGKVTKTSMKEAFKLADDRVNRGDLRKAFKQAAAPKLDKKDMKFAITQANKLYGMSREQAIDTITKLTAEVQLYAIRQADDTLKARDAARARKQAAEIRLSLADEMHAAEQAHDKKLDTLTKGTEEYAKRQIVSQFAGVLTRANADLAWRLTDDAAKKKEKFEEGFRKWEEEREEALIRKKYTLQRQALLGESNEIKKPKPNHVKKVKKKQPAPLDILSFHKKLAAIRAAADKEVHKVHRGAYLASSMAFGMSAPEGPSS